MPQNLHTTIDIGLIIRRKMDEYGTSVAWLAKQVGADRSNLGKQLQQKHIYPELLHKISITLKTDFFAYYSEEIKSALQI